MYYITALIIAKYEISRLYGLPTPKFPLTCNVKSTRQRCTHAIDSIAQIGSETFWARFQGKIRVVPKLGHALRDGLVFILHAPLEIEFGRITGSRTGENDFTVTLRLNDATFRPIWNE